MGLLAGSQDAGAAPAVLACVLPLTRLWAFPGQLCLCRIGQLLNPLWVQTQRSAVAGGMGLWMLWSWGWGEKLLTGRASCGIKQGCWAVQLLKSACPLYFEWLPKDAA